MIWLAIFSFSVLVIAAIINWSHFQSVLDKVQERFERLGLSTGYAFLTGNDKDALIGHRLREEYGKTATRDYGLFELHEKFQKAPNGTITYTYKGNEKTVALAVVNPEPLRSQIAWGLGVGINNEEIFAPIQKLKLWFFVISLMIAVLAGAISLLFGRAVSLSLREFTQLARDASRGRFVKLAKARSYDELGGLAQAFDQRKVELLTGADLDLAPERVGEAGSPTRVLSIKPVTHERRCRFLEGETAEVADQLMDHLIAKGLVD